MLGANAHSLTSSIHLLKNIITKQRYRSTAATNQTCEHRDGRGLASAVVAKQAEYLVSIHLHIKPVDSFKAIFILFMQIIDLKKVLLLFFIIDLRV